MCMHSETHIFGGKGEEGDRVRDGGIGGEKEGSSTLGEECLSQNKMGALQNNILLL